MEHTVGNLKEKQLPCQLIQDSHQQLQLFWDCCLTQHQCREAWIGNAYFLTLQPLHCGLRQHKAPVNSKAAAHWRVHLPLPKTNLCKEPQNDRQHILQLTHAPVGLIAAVGAWATIVRVNPSGRSPHIHFITLQEEGAGGIMCNSIQISLGAQRLHKSAHP